MTISSTRNASLILPVSFWEKGEGGVGEGWNGDSDALGVCCFLDGVILGAFAVLG